VSQNNFPFVAIFRAEQMGPLIHDGTLYFSGDVDTTASIEATVLSERLHSLQFGKDFYFHDVLSKPEMTSSLQRRTKKWSRVRITEFSFSVHELVTMLLVDSGVKIDMLELDRLDVLDPELDAALERGLAATYIHAFSILNIVIPVSSTIALIEGISSNATIEEIHFTNSRFEDAFVLGDRIGRWTSIKKLDLFSCSLSDAQSCRIVQSVQYLPSLVHLDLADNQCSTQTLQALSALLATTNTLETLNLALQRNNEDSDQASIDSSSDTDCWDISLIVSGLLQNQSLTTLYLRGNALDDHGVERLVGCLLGNSTLQKLMLTDCQLSSTAYYLILEQLANMKGLTCLWLNGHQSFQLSKRKSLLAICTESLGKNTSLWELYLPFSLVDSCDDLYHYLDLNQGGRKHVMLELPPTLWSLVLERVNTLTFSLGKHGDDELARRRASVLYFFLRQRLLLEVLLVVLIPTS
jgi:hypothetical protein